MKTTDVPAVVEVVDARKNICMLFDRNKEKLHDNGILVIPFDEGNHGIFLCVTIDSKK